MRKPLLWRMWHAFGRFQRWLASYVTGNDPRVLVAWTPFLLLALVLFTRHPGTNYIFDEQEALLANPYVTAAGKRYWDANHVLTYWDAIRVDFWGLPPDASIGSYRPLPNFIWRATWSLHYSLPKSLAHLPKHPFFHHLYNIALHSLNAALLAAFAFAVTKRRSLGWLAGLAMLGAAVITEAVSGIVGLADVLGGLGALIALHALRLPAWGMPLGVFAGVLVGLFSKESALVCVPLVPVAALVTAPMLHRERPARVVRTLLAFAAALSAFVLYVELRKVWFPSPIPEALQKEIPGAAHCFDQAVRPVQRVLSHVTDKRCLKADFRELMIWFHQAPLPKDPLNNPLVNGDFPHRVAGALRVYWRGMMQVIFPLRLSGDYSFPQEPLPTTLYGWESIAGGLMMVAPPLGALLLWILSLFRERRDRRGLQAQSAVVPSQLGGPTDPVRRTEPSSWRRNVVAVGVCIKVAALVSLATELVMMKRGHDWGVRTWPAALALLACGVGVMVEGWRAKQPVIHDRPLPWRHVLSAIVALGLVWIVVSYFPHSNIPVVLPTVRAERFWYFPVIGSSLMIGALFAWLAERFPSRRFLRVLSWPVALATAFFGFQCVRCYLHAMDYRDDVAFWYATKKAVPNSAKAHLNYSVMVGARGDMETRLAESHIARKLAPKWAMAHIYTGDTLCRMHRAEEAWPHYKAGFELGPNDKSLISLALQCMYDEKIFFPHEDELRELSDKHAAGNSWLTWLINDTLWNHEKNKGVSPKHRPRGYNQGAD